MRIAVAYLSSVKKGLPKAVIRKIFAELDAWNNQRGVSGISLYSDGNFFHFFEGEKDTVELIQKIMVASPNQHSLIKVFEKESHKKAFNGFKAEMVSAETKYQPEKVQTYTNHLRVLDPKAREAAEKILERFIASH